MMSLQLKAAMEWVRAQDKRLRADDPRLGHWVYIVHEDFSVEIIRDAFFVPVETDGDFIAVFAEHREGIAHHQEEIRGIWMLKVVRHVSGRAG